MYAIPIVKYNFWGRIKWKYDGVSVCWNNCYQGVIAASSAELVQTQEA